MQDGAETLCPYCGSPLWVAVDRVGGRQQQFVSDCETCCRPILFRAQVDPETGEVVLDGERESD